MAFDLTRMGVLTTSTPITYVSGQTVNGYAEVTAFDATTITISGSNQIAGDIAQFTVGTEIFFHVSASPSGYKKYLGLWSFAKITAVSGNVLTVDADMTTVLPTSQLSNYYVQILSVPFLQITDTATTYITPPAYDVSKRCGGIIVLKNTRGSFGKHPVDLTDKGIPPANKNLRPLFNYETNGMLDTDPYAGWENAMLEHRLPLNSGDGAALIYSAASSPYNSTHPRFGSTISGVRNCRGASDSPNLPDNATNIGGSTILVVNRKNGINAIGNGVNFRKYRSASSAEGKGLGAVLYVTDSVGVVNDGALFARTQPTLGLPDDFKLDNQFGDGSLGNATNANCRVQMNNYAYVPAVTAKTVSAATETKRLHYTKKTTVGRAPIQKDALVMVVTFETTTNGKDSVLYPIATTLCKVLADDGATLTIDKAVDMKRARWCMVVSIPQFNNFTMSASYPNDRTPAFDGKVGGFFAIAVNGTCSLVNGKIDLRTDVAASKADSITTHSPTLNERSTLLSLGQGLGSALILARNLTMSENTRIGGLNSGAQLGGCGFTASATVEGGGYRGHDSANGSALGGHGGSGGEGAANGGFLSNGDSNSGISQGRQGAHVLIIADTITDFNIAALSTGGQHPQQTAKFYAGSGGCGYGGGGYGTGGANQGAGGGFRGGGAGGSAGGGAAGYAFVYCNNAVNQSTDAILLD